MFRGKEKLQVCTFLVMLLDEKRANLYEASIVNQILEMQTVIKEIMFYGKNFESDDFFTNASLFTLSLALRFHSFS